MTRIAARVVMALAARCFGGHRREWAVAMQVEFEAAGEPLRFALGCLWSAWREMPAHEGGRFAIASHILTAGVILPIALSLLASVARGFPVMVPADVDGARLLGSHLSAFPVTDANRAGLPPLIFLTVALGLGHLFVAWAILDRDWARVATIGRIGAAMVATTMLFAGILFLDDVGALLQATAVAIELAAIAMLVRWHADLSDVVPGRPHAPSS